LQGKQNACRGSEEQSASVCFTNRDVSLEATL
jgi:hypothetical protein